MHFKELSQRSRYSGGAKKGAHRATTTLSYTQHQASRADSPSPRSAPDDQLTCAMLAIYGWGLRCIAQLDSLALESAEQPTVDVTCCLAVEA